MGVMDSGFDAAHRPGMTALLLGVMGSCAQAPTHMLCRSFERRCSMTSSQTTPCGSGSRIALRLCGTTAVDVGCRHCERSEAIHGTSAMKVDCFAALAMTGLGTATRNQLGPSFPDVNFPIVDAPFGEARNSLPRFGVMDSGFDAAHRPGMTALLRGVMGPCAPPSPHMLCRSFERRCSMTSSQTTPCG